MKRNGLAITDAVMELVPTGRGRDALWCDDYQFIFNRSYGNQWYWRCWQRYEEGIMCTASIHSDIGGKSGFLMMAPHCDKCFGRSGVKEANKAVAECKRIATYSFEAPLAIVTRIDGGLPLKAAMHLPLKRNLARSYRRSRAAALGFNLSANTLSTISCAPGLVRHRSDEEQTILQYDSGQDDLQRMIMLGTEASLDLLVSYADWHGDGTFRCVPLMFDQMFSVHVRVNRKVWPACLVLMVGKQQMKYEAILRQLVRLRPAIANKSITFTSDFELAIRNAVMSVFPDETHCYCLFHLLRNVWRKVQSLGLQRYYCADPELALAVKMLPALCYVPSEMVSDAYCAILSDRRYAAILAQYPVMVEFVQYFEKHYVGC